MSFLSNCRVEPDLEEQYDGPLVPERNVTHSDEIRSLQPPSTIINANAGARRVNRSERLTTMRSSNSQKTKRQVVFICGRDRDVRHWAIQVPVHIATPLARRRGSKIEKRCDCEQCDVTIYRNLNEAFWAQVGLWRKYIPLYGIIKVEEVKFQIRTLRDEQYGVLLEHLDYKKIEEEARYQIDLAENSQDEYADKGCARGTGIHSKSCLEMMDFANDPCFLEQSDKAYLRPKRLKCLDLLTKHFKSPLTAAEGSSLKGLARESYIYDERFLRIPQSPQEADEDTNSYCGLFVELGWHTTGILPRNDFVVAVIGVCVATWKYVNGDLDTGSAFGILFAFLWSFKYTNG